MPTYPLPAPENLHLSPDPRTYKRPLVVAVDFDGVLTTDIAFPAIGKPNWPMIDYLVHARAAGHTLILWTCRCGQALDDAIDAARAWGLQFDYVNKNAVSRIAQYGIDSRKISADIYIDDHAVVPWHLAPWPPDLIAALQRLALNHPSGVPE